MRAAAQFRRCPTTLPIPLAAIVRAAQPWAMRILVVEDDPVLRSSVSRGLGEAGYGVDAAADAAEGEWFAGHNDYDLLVLDRNLPDRDGLDLLRSLRERGFGAAVLILTARGEVGERIDGLNAGADDYLAKPFDFGELVARVAALVRRRYGERRSVVEIGDLVVDLGARRVSLGQREIQLTAREHSLLEYLVLRRGEVVSRDEIYDKVYAFEDDVASNVVDVYIGYLRKKLERDGAPKLIRTHRGKGYELWDGTDLDA